MKQLISYAANLSRIYVSSKRHPLRQLLVQLAACDVSVLRDTAISAWRSFLDAVIDEFREDSVLAASEWRDYISVIEE